MFILLKLFILLKQQCKTKAALQHIPKPDQDSTVQSAHVPIESVNKIPAQHFFFSSGVIAESDKMTEYLICMCNDSHLN